MKSKAQTRAFDEKCLDLAKYFYPDATREQLDVLADDIQNVVEDASDEMSQDPTPWCTGCGAMLQQNCDCGPIAANE